MTGQDDGHRDAGFTLVELLVAMGLFAVLLTVMMGAIGAMTTDLRKTNGVSEAADQARRAFDRLDKQVRYADAISTPGKVGSDWYVEFLTTDTQGQHVCRQWRVEASTDRLQQRSWTPGTTPSSTPSWATVAVGVVNDPVALPPFVAEPTAADSDQQLSIDLLVERGARPAGRAETKTTFSARNTDLTVTNFCKEVTRS